MTMTDPMIRDTGLAVPLVALVGAIGGGIELGLETGIVATAMWLNLCITARLASAAVFSAAEAGTPGIWQGALWLKGIAAYAATLAAVWFFHPVAVLLGLSILFLGGVSRGAAHALTPRESA
jgi:hypothetical protein